MRFVTLFAVATAFPNIGRSAVHECPPFWTEFQGNCYRFFGAATTWDNAEAHCQEFFMPSSQGHLASIHSDAEFNFVQQLWKSSLVTSSQISSTYGDNPSGPQEQHAGDSILIGLNDKETEGTMVWSDSTPNDYDVFGTNQPDNANTGEDCVDVVDTTSWSTNQGVVWNDIPCSWSTDLPYVCKMSAVSDKLKGYLRAQLADGGQTLG